MTKLIILLLVSSFSMSLYAQKGRLDSDAVNTCAGAINIFENGEFQLQFTGKKSESSFAGYASLNEVEKDNQLWCSFIAQYSGDLTFKASKKSGFLQMVVFTQEKNDICGEIRSGVSEIKRLHIKKDVSMVGLDPEIGDGVLYTLKLSEGQKINLLLAAEAESKDKVLLNWDFRPEILIESETKIVDRRLDDFTPALNIQVRDKVTKEPLIASLTLEGKAINQLHVGSDFFFNLERSGKITLKCDVEGYFFDDRVEPVSSQEDMEIVIYLEQIARGKSIQIEEIEFVPGTSQIVESSEPKLNRLRDFLALNSDINVEIQGHVFALGNNSFAGQKISEARAKRVMKFLIENGIDKSRLTAVGYGNTKPIFAEPKFYYEEQANRRVEIMIK
jgi:outer membrane protein OmpA-like peptidoglycan-associated protein